VTAAGIYHAPSPTTGQKKGGCGSPAGCLFLLVNAYDSTAATQRGEQVTVIHFTEVYYPL